jgi:predicted MFS family arabinose efflux permease
MLFIYGLYSLIIGIVFVILARDKPPTPPSIKLLKEDDKVKGSLKLLLSNRMFWFLLIIFFVGLGAFNMITTYIELIVAPRGLSSIEAGNLGGIMLLGGIIGAQVLSILADKLRKRVLLIRISLVITVASFFLLSFATTTILIYVSGFLLGFGLMSVGPVLVEYAVEITVPAPEASSNGLLMVTGSISGIIFIMGFEKFTTPSGDYLPALIVLSILSLIAFILSFFLKDIKR